MGTGIDFTPAAMSTTAAQCRQLAESYKFCAREAGISPKRANLLTNVARSYSGLASQLEILATELTENGGK